MVFDNAISVEQSKLYIPNEGQLRGQILVTTQQNQFFQANADKNISLNTGITSVEAIKFLRQITGLPDDIGANTKQLAAELEGLPLWLSIAAIYIREENKKRQGVREKLLDYNSYLALLHNEAKKLEKDQTKK